MTSELAALAARLAARMPTESTIDVRQQAVDVARVILEGRSRPRPPRGTVPTASVGPDEIGYHC